MFRLILLGLVVMAAMHGCKHDGTNAAGDAKATDGTTGKSSGAAGAAMPVARALLGLDENDDKSAYDKAELVRGFLRRLGSFINGSASGIDAALHVQGAQQQALQNAAIARQADARFRVAYITPGSTLQYLGLPLPAGAARDDKLFDIMVDRRTGAARSVVLSHADFYHAVDPAKIALTDATLGSPATASVQADNRPPRVFAYGAADQVEQVSLRGLENAPILDDQHKKAGSIDTIVYRDQAAKALIFTVPGTTPGSGTMFTLPYGAVMIGTGKDGAQFAQMNRDQTAAVAGAMARGY